VLVLYRDLRMGAFDGIGCFGRLGEGIWANIRYMLVGKGFNRDFWLFLVICGSEV